MTAIDQLSLESSEEFSDATIMITGGTGSFGQTLVSRFLNTNVRRIVVFSRDEKKQDEMRAKFSSSKVSFFIGDVRDEKSLQPALRDVNYVFHAAALKQVPSCEFFPLEAVKTNVLGTQNVIDAAINAGVSRLVLLSTDKAVYPINAMGITKALAEKMLIASARALGSMNGTTLCITRYGNVMGSRGSVIPLFLDQIRKGQPITITDPSMTRFLMSLEESVDLVLHAFKHAEQGDLFVQKAPSCTVETLAKALAELLSSRSEIQYMGFRHGEKLFESLISREEMAKSIDMGKFVKIPADKRDLNYQGTANIVSAQEELHDYTSHNTKILTIAEVKSILLGLEIVKQGIARQASISR